MSEPQIESIRTRLITRRLSRPWGPDVPELHAIVVEVTAGSSSGQGFSWTPTIGPHAVQALLDHDITAFAVGRPARPELIWDDLWRHLHEAGGGGLTTIAMAGLDLALWDLRAKAAGVGLSELLGVRRRSVRAYGSGVNLHYSLDQLTEQAHRWVAAGYRGAKIKVGSPDLDRDLERVAAVRDILGPQRWLAVDANQRWDVPAAERGIRALQRFDLHWIEEPVRADDLAAYRYLRTKIGLPLACGENVHTAYRFREFLAAEAIDVVQPNIVRVGGLTPFLRIADLVRTADRTLAPHLLPDLSAQIAFSLPEAVWIEEVEDAGLEGLGFVDEPTPVLRRGAELALADDVGGHRVGGLGLHFG
ncbi:mandelate racemase/muconate lactonizing enzyme family protein [Microlunatus ginsengisoli]|uniref:Mandelate racemase/muconate lactonizing enzyme family protein n=1 Tax=Microlunatus ginsengisoli TaxID=363863 RepID=A0ABP6ZNM9_9ACTN